MASIKLLSATGMLGSGFRESSVQAAVAEGVDLIGCDAGTTDGGPSYLATGKAAFSDAAISRDLDLLIKHGTAARKPVVIGSAGMSGCDAGVDRLAGMALESLRRHGLKARLARIYSEQTAETLRPYLERGDVAALPPAASLRNADLDQSVRIVAVMGVEPIQAALDDGADIIIAGRCTDAAIFAALPLMNGADAGASWHMGKILECGAAAVEQRSAPDCMMATIEGDSFDVMPLRSDYRCTPQSIASHALYETADPLVLIEPSGILHLADSTYSAISDRAVRVRGSRFQPAFRYSNKIEGVRQAGFSSIVIGSIRDPFILADLDRWLETLSDLVENRLANTAGGAPNARYEIFTHVYGRDGTMGRQEPKPVVEGHEVAILWNVVAESQSLAESIATSLNHLALHNPIAKWSGLITGVALPFSPAQVNRGAVYEFHLNHVVYPGTPRELFRTELDNA